MNQYDLSRLFDVFDSLLKGSRIRANHFMLVKIHGGRYVHFEHMETKVRVIMDYERKSIIIPKE